MTPESVMMMGTEAMKIAIAVAAPLLLVALVTGLIISILQAATQINEMTLSFIPKIIAVFVAIIVAGPWMLNLLLDYMRNGHLWLISMLVDTFHTLPIGENTVNSNAFLALTRAAGLIFLNGLMLALPIITLLLTVNLALGLLNRMAPQLSIFVIGFPLTLTVGILLMSLLMPLIAPFCEHLFGEIFNLLADIVSELPRK